MKQQSTDTKIYSVRWFLQCYIDTLPFSLTLRVWDLFLLLGDIILLAMAYNILKLHSKTLVKMDMDLIADFFQKKLPASFGFEDDYVIDCLRESLEELNSMQLDTNSIINSSPSRANLDGSVKQSHSSQTLRKSILNKEHKAPVPSVNISKNEDTSDTSDDEVDDKAPDEADLTVIVEDHDESVHSIQSSRSVNSSRDDISNSYDFYEVGIINDWQLKCFIPSVFLS